MGGGHSGMPVVPQAHHKQGINGQRAVMVDYCYLASEFVCKGYELCDQFSVNVDVKFNSSISVA